jgi:hypothetical protein
MNYLFSFLVPNNSLLEMKNWYRPTDLLSTRVFYSSYHGSESCQIGVSDLIWFIDKSFALILAWT